MSRQMGLQFLERQKDNSHSKYLMPFQARASSLGNVSRQILWLSSLRTSCHLQLLQPSGLSFANSFPGLLPMPCMHFVMSFLGWRLIAAGLPAPTRSQSPLPPCDISVAPQPARALQAPMPGGQGTHLASNAKKHATARTVCSTEGTANVYSWFALSGCANDSTHSPQ